MFNGKTATIRTQGFAPIGILDYWNNAFWGNAMLFLEAKNTNPQKTHLTSVSCRNPKTYNDGYQSSTSMQIISITLVRVGPVFTKSPRDSKNEYESLDARYA